MIARVLVFPIYLLGRLGSAIDRVMTKIIWDTMDAYDREMEWWKNRPAKKKAKKRR